MTAQINLNEGPNLVNGPSKFDLMLALFDKASGRKVTFVGDDGVSYVASITSVEHEDGSGESWNITGSARLYLSGSPHLLDSDSKDATRRLSYHFKGHFRTNKRSGYIKLV